MKNGSALEMPFPGGDAIRELKAAVEHGKISEADVDARLDELLELVNKTGVGPSGLGGSTTALAVNVEFTHTHIGGMPCAVNLNCHQARKAEAEI